MRTSADGFSERWRAVIDRFFARHDVAVSVAINDFGATPPTVLLRLEQAIEEAFCDRLQPASSPTLQP